MAASSRKAASPKASSPKALPAARVRLKPWRPPLPPSVPETCGRNWWAPAPDWADWARETFIEGSGRLVNTEHRHLRQATIGFLLTTAENKKNGRRIAGTASIPVPGAGWSGARARWLRHHWFGIEPDFIVTLDANLIAAGSPGWICGLIEHELLHCGQARDAFSGAPLFSMVTGRPIFAIRPHDSEQFVSIVRRYGAEAAMVEGLIEAAQEAPLFDDVDITSICCGTCR